MKIALIGWNGAKNAGDDAMTLSMLYRLKEKYPKIKRVQIVSISKDASFEYIKKSDFDFEIRIDRNNAYAKNRFLKYILIRTIYPIRIALQNNLIIIGGGSIFHSKGDNSIYLRMIFFARFINFFDKTEIISIGTSVGPFYTMSAEKKFEKILNGLGEIEVRDSRSFHYCNNKLGVNSTKLVLYHDLAIDLKKFINLPSNDFKNNEVSDLPIAVILRRGKLANEQKKWLLDFLDFIFDKKKDTRFKFISFCNSQYSEENDLLEIQNFLSLIPEKYKENIDICEYNENLDELLTLLHASQFVISARLHGSILAHMLNKKFIMLSYHPKCQDFFNDLKLDNSLLIKSREIDFDFSNILRKVS